MLLYWPTNHFSLITNHYLSEGWQSGLMHRS